MPSLSPKTSRPQLVEIHGQLTSQRSHDVARELREALGDFEHVCFDLSGVESIDVMGLQLLLAARATQRSKGRTLSYSSASEAVRELCAALGFQVENG